MYLAEAGSWGPVACPRLRSLGGPEAAEEREVLLLKATSPPLLFQNGRFPHQNREAHMLVIKMKMIPEREET